MSLEMTLVLLNVLMKHTIQTGRCARPELLPAGLGRAHLCCSCCAFGFSEAQFRLLLHLDEVFANPI